MKSFTVTIRDTTAWTTRLRAKGSIEAENLALDMFRTATDRSDYFEEHSDTTVQVEEVVE